MPRITIANPQTARAQFDEFTKFARTAGVGGRTVVQLGNVAGAVHSIAPKSKFDFIGNIGRRAESRGMNNDTRDLFLESVVKMLGVPDKNALPDTVKEAMKLGDYYDKNGAPLGKPLTARRIIAVQMAVKQLKLEATIKTALGYQPTDNLDPELKKRINTAVAACKGDEATFASLKKNWRAILLVEGEDPLRAFTVRGDSDVSRLVGKLVPDKNLLHTIVGNDPNDQELYNAAKPFLVYREQARISDSSLAKIVTEVKQLQTIDLAEIRRLSAHSSTLDLHTATVKFCELVNSIMERCGLGKADWLDEKNYRQKLVANLVLVKAFPNKADIIEVQKLFHAPRSGAAPSRPGTTRLAYELRCFYKVAPWWVQDQIKGARGDFLLNKASDLIIDHNRKLTHLQRAVDQICDGISADDEPVEAPNARPEDLVAWVKGLHDDERHIFKFILKGMSNLVLEDGLSNAQMKILAGERS